MVGVPPRPPVSPGAAIGIVAPAARSAEAAAAGSSVPYAGPPGFQGWPTGARSTHAAWSVHDDAESRWFSSTTAADDSGWVLCSADAILEYGQYMPQPPIPGHPQQHQQGTHAGKQRKRKNKKDANHYGLVAAGMVASATGQMVLPQLFDQPGGGCCSQAKEDRPLLEVCSEYTCYKGLHGDSLLSSV
jgi:hypothetical protein